MSFSSNIGGQTVIVRFDEAFQSLTGFPPMKWQRRLFDRFVRTGTPDAPDIPSVCDIPTGLGKTSVIVIWLLALVQQAKDGQVHLPRRLVYVVNRRTVVDQATDIVEQMRRRLSEPEALAWRDCADALRSVASILHGLCAFEGNPLGVSTLRGELADNGEWKVDPSRPAVIVGTIDMIGSKMLFSGYGDGRYWRTHHAGLIGQDALIVHDEAHLTPAFGELLRCVGDEQHRSGDPRPVRVMELSATQRGDTRGTFGLEPEDETDKQTGQIVRQRLDEKKRLYLHHCHGDAVAELAKKARVYFETPSKVLIYIRSPKDAQKLVTAIGKELGDSAKERVALLTGSIRGYERDRLIDRNLVYRALADHDAAVSRGVFLVSTSAGEVGIDIDADHLICDLTTLDSLIQRLGRVNRHGGENREARIDLVWTDDDEKGGDKPLQKAVAATLQTLRRWISGSSQRDGLLVSPRNLQALLEQSRKREQEIAFSPSPAVAPLTDILLDNWSLTSIDRMPGRPDVAPFLHGLTFEAPETYVAWRAEVSALRSADVANSALREWFHTCRLEARESLRERTDRVKKALADLLRKLRKDDHSADSPVVLLDERGGVSWSSLAVVVTKDVDLVYRTIVMPVEAGGLSGYGMLEPKGDPSPELDVAEHDADSRQRERWLHHRSPEGDRYKRLVSGEVFDAFPGDLREKIRIPLRQGDEGEEEDERLDLVLLVSPVQSALDNPETASAWQTLAAHTNAISERMARIAERLNLDESLQAALITGARWHDKGKDRVIWQRYARNSGNAEILAKAKSYLHWRTLGGYRHEFGSLLDAMNNEELRQLPERELVLHLISAHHGWARPNFEPRSFDSSCATAANNQAFSEVVRRFGQLQQRFGRWGLAWLESLVRCADIAASKQAAASTPSVGNSAEFTSKEAET